MFLVSHTVAMVTYGNDAIDSPMIGEFFDTMLVVSAD